MTPRCFFLAKKMSFGKSKKRGRPSHKNWTKWCQNSHVCLKIVDVEGKHFVFQCFVIFAFAIGIMKMFKFIAIYNDFAHALR